MYSTNSHFGDVPVQLDYEFDKNDNVELLAVWIGSVDIISGLSLEQISNFESVCHWAVRIKE